MLWAAGQKSKVVCELYTLEIRLTRDYCVFMRLEIIHMSMFMLETAHHQLYVVRQVSNPTPLRCWCKALSTKLRW